VSLAKLMHAVAQARPWQKNALFLLLGALAALGHAPVGWPLVSMAALVAVFWLFGTLTRAPHAAWAGWFTGSGYFAATVYWIVNPFFVDAENQAWMAPFALFFMATGLALFWGAAFGGAYHVPAARWRPIALAISLTLAELARSYMLTGFPWGLVAYVWADTPLMIWAAWLGPHGLTLITLALATLPVAGRTMVQRFAVPVAVGVGLWQGGVASLDSVQEPRDPAVHLRLIQPNAPQEKKWNPAHATTFFTRLLDLTAAPSATPADFVIWPETAVTFWLDEYPEYQARIAQVAGPDSRVILGAIRAGQNKYFNALAVLGPDGTVQQVYDKSHLVPFGEYIPFGDWLADIGIHGLAASEGQGFSAGPGSHLLDLGKAGKVLPLICYEAIFPQLVNSPTERPDWILQITNDAWFGHIAGPQQHLVQARFRAVEQGLPLVRVANTGITAVIDPRGRITAFIPLDTADKLDVTVPASLPRTAYSRTGDWPVFLLTLFGLGFLWIRRRSI